MISQLCSQAPLFKRLCSRPAISHLPFDDNASRPSVPRYTVNVDQAIFASHCTQGLAPCETVASCVFEVLNDIVVLYSLVFKSTLAKLPCFLLNS